MPFEASGISGQLLFLGTGTSVGVPVIGCDCSTCTSSDPRDQRLRCALALGLPGGNLLVDTPPDLRTQLLRERLAKIDAVLFTHEHVDHLYGLDDVRILTHYLGHRMPLFCEAPVEARIRRAFDYAFGPEAQLSHPGGVPRLELRTIGKEPFEILGARAIPIPLKHGRFDVLGFRFGDVAYCTDTNGIPEESWPLLKGLDVLVLDALRPRPHATHFGLDESIEVARRVGARQTYFTHMSHELPHVATNAALPSGMQLAYDGLRIRLT